MMSKFGVDFVEIFDQGLFDLQKLFKLELGFLEEDLEDYEYDDSIIFVFFMCDDFIDVRWFFEWM